MSFARADLLDAVAAGGLRYLLDLTYAGRVFRLSTDTFTVQDEDGNALRYVDALEGVDWQDVLELFSDAPELASIPFEFVLPGTDVAELVSKGHDLGAATGELSQWIVGTPYEDRRVLLSGRVIEPTYGAEGEPIAFSLEANPFEDRALLLDPSAIVDEQTWPNAEEGALGRSYPLVVGGPGTVGPRLTDRIKATPGLVVDSVNRYLLIADREVDASVAYFADASEPVSSYGWGSAAVSHMEDGRGRKIAYVQLPTMGDGAYVAGHEYLVCWGFPGLGGGTLTSDRTAVLETAGDVLQWVLDRSTLRVDEGRTAAAVELLQGYRVAFYVDDPTISPWEWVRANLLPILPVSIVAGPDGLYPVVWRWWARKTDAVAHIDTGLGKAERVGPVEYSPRSEVANEIVVRYALEDDTGEFKRSVVIHGDAEDPDRNDPFSVAGSATEANPTYLHHLCRISLSRYGRAVHVIETPVVYDRTTAMRIATWKARAYAVPSRVIRVDVDMVEYGWLELGDAVLFTDADLHISEQLCLVEAVAWPDEVGDPQLILRTVEEDARD